MASAEGQATLDAIAAVEAALTNLDTIIAAAEAGGPAWDNATPAQRTAAIRTMAKAIRGCALILKGLKAPLGTARVPD